MSATLLLLGGGLLVLTGATFALSLAVGSAERRGVAGSLALIRALETAPQEAAVSADESFTRGVVAPFTERFAQAGRRLTRSGAAERLQYRLDVAGNPPGWNVERIIGAKVLGLAVLGGVTFLYGMALGAAPVKVVLLAAGLSAAGFLLPNLLLYNAGTKRETLMQRSLPDALDLLTISVEAGLGFDSAVLKVAQRTTGPLAQELSRLLQEMQIGVGRTEAMRAMGERTTMKDLRAFCQAMVQADQLGVPVGRVLRIQSKEMRTKRRQRAEEQAQKVPVKIMVPLVLFILPCLFVVVLGPAALRMMEVFGR